MTDTNILEILLDRYEREIIENTEIRSRFQEHENCSNSRIEAMKENIKELEEGNKSLQQGLMDKLQIVNEQKKRIEELEEQLGHSYDNGYNQEDPLEGE